MAPALGKRKLQSKRKIRDTESDSEESSGSQNEDVQDVFRRHFEARFKPLPTVEKAAKVVKHAVTDGNEEDSEWGGLSESEGILQNHDQD